MSQLTRRAATAGALAAATALSPLAAAGTASAATVPATLAVNAACYVVGRTAPPITISGSGYAAGDEVSVSDRNGLDATATVDAAGQFTVTTKAPVPDLRRPGQVKDTITAKDFNANGTTYVGTTTTYLSALAAAANKTRRAPGLQALTFRTKWSFSGFPVGRTIHAHYLFGGKVVANQAFGRAKGPCGTLTVTKRLFPSTPHHREYRLQIDAARRYAKTTTPRLDSKVGVGLF
jgi:hypothetical protein